MNRKYGGSSIPNDVVDYRVAVQGAGAAAPTVCTNAQFPAIANCHSRVAAEIPTRSGVGAYILFVAKEFQTPQILTASVEITGTVGAWGQVSAFSAATRQLTVKVFAPGGAAADLVNGTDQLVVMITARDTNT